VNLARKGPGLGVGAAGVLALAAELVLDELLVLLELPQPARTNATPRARIDVLGTGVSPVVRNRTRRFPDHSPPRPGDLANPPQLVAAISARLVVARLL
jgi:hypothetical protein